MLLRLGVPRYALPTYAVPAYGIAGEVGTPSIPGIELRLADTRLHYRLADTRLHYRVREDK